jgi:hypothetical protein
MLPAGEALAGAGGGWLAGDAYPEDELLAGLGSAARLFPTLEQAVRGIQVEFVNQRAQALMQ